jgi:hypothetical protein
LAGGSGESGFTVVGGDIGISSTIICPSNETELSLCDLLERSSVGPSTADRAPREIDCGAPSRLCASGKIFSSSAMIGSLDALLIALACGEAMLPSLLDMPLVGESVGDLAGLTSCKR